MGLRERRGIQGATDGQTTPDKLGVLHRSLQAKGWTDSDYGFSLARLIRGVDVLRDTRRVLFYEADPSDAQWHATLLRLKLPLFQSTISPSSEGVSSVELPNAARALDSMKFPETTSQPGYLGSFEIMEEVARLLASIYRATGNVPEDLRLGRLALVPGEKNIARLVPPLKLTPTKDWEKSLESLYQDLIRQDPDHEHAGQIQHLKDSFRRFLEDENH